jgi:hypothetical protein
LGQVAADRALPVEIRWRDTHGQVQVRKFTLKPGWHTIELG